MNPLYIFIDLEAAHGNNYFGDIIELAAQVDPRVLDNEIFCTLINTRQNLSYFALHVSRITKRDLLKKKYFPDVFVDFMAWISKVVLECNKIMRKEYYPVLVAHGGFDNDFMMIQSNLERNEMSLDLLKNNNLHFGDTYALAKKLQSKSVGGLGNCQLSIKKLFERLFPRDRLIGQHRALPDVQFMIKIFLETNLEKHFHELPVATFDNRNDDYVRNNTMKSEKSSLEKNLPKNMAKVTHCMTLTRLLRNGLTYTRLQSFFESAESTLDFFDKLKDLGIQRKAAKAMAGHLASSGLSCRGTIEKESRIEVGELIPNEQSGGKLKCERSDSGYASIVNEDRTDEDWERFYKMFSDDFFYPPEVYEVTFGLFTIKEIEQLDIYIGDVFETRFGELELTDDFHCDVDLCASYENQALSNVYNSNQTQVKSYTETNSKDDFMSGGENWEDECSHEIFNMPAPIKVIPIGMTMNNFNGEEFSQKVPLFKHFDTFNTSSAPIGGIPKPVGKAARYNRWKCKSKNKKSANSMDLMSGNAGHGKIIAKTSSGEVFILV